MEYVLVIVGGLLAWHLLGQSQRRARADKIARERREKVLAAELAREKHLTAFPEPIYQLSDDPILAALEREFIQSKVVPWAEYEIDKDDVLEPYWAAGDELTPELREAIVEEERGQKYLRAIEEAKKRAHDEFKKQEAEEENERIQASEAKARLAEFVARQNGKRQ